MITIGSCFSGIGGFELGLESAIPNSKTIWQIEQDEFCQQILKKHWPHAHIHGDIKNATEQNLERPDLLVAGFPCQDISIAGKGEGIIKGSRSSLFFDMWRLCLQLRPSIVILENVPALYSRGLGEVLRTVAESGIYGCEWGYLEAQYFGAPHKRRRIFIVCYLADSDSNGLKAQCGRATKELSGKKNRQQILRGINSEINPDATDTDSERNVSEQRPRTQTRGRARDCSEKNNSTDTDTGRKERPLCSRRDQFESKIHPNIWRRWTQESPLIAKVRGVDDGLSAGLDRDRRKRLKALGNAIVPQCSAWIGQRLILTGKLECLR